MYGIASSEMASKIFDYCDAVWEVTSQFLDLWIVCTAVSYGVSPHVYIAHLLNLH